MYFARLIRQLIELSNKSNTLKMTSNAKGAESGGGLLYAPVRDWERN